MPKAIRTPRINNNDDFVRLVHVAVEVGTRVQRGDLVAEIETDKANVSVESEESGWVLAICTKPGEEIPVGGVLVWLGDSPEEQVPGNDVQSSAPTTGALASLKAALLLREYKLDSAVIPHPGERISAEDVERYVQSNGLHRPLSASPASLEAMPNASGKVQHLTSEERAMLRTVLWHRDSAVPGYIEFPYDPKPWSQYAAKFQQMHKLMFDPLLALMAFRLSSIARERPLLNSTIVGDSRHLYDQVNLGFTVQVGTTLYMVVIRGAEALTEKEFVDRLSRLQISAMKKSLRADEVTGATLAFTSMARWPVTRHLPILPPHVSFIAAHVGTAVDGSSQLGATYDHRVLTGFDVVEVLREMGRPPKTDPPEKTNE